MILIVGLGNPGAKYKKTRHNIGFMIVESLKLKVKSSSDWKYEKKFLAEISQGKIGDQKMIFAKPQTFMNKSGKAVKPLNSEFKILNSKLLVVHDDIDLLIGKIKISKNRGHGGHKGVESIIQELKTKNFIRFRIGIKPKPYLLAPKTLDRFVLQKFNKKEEEIIKQAVKKTVEAIESVLKQGLEKTMNKYNT